MFYFLLYEGWLTELSTDPSTDLLCSWRLLRLTWLIETWMNLWTKVHTLHCHHQGWTAEWPAWYKDWSEHCELHWLWSDQTREIYLNSLLPESLSLFVLKWFKKRNVCLGMTRRQTHTSHIYLGSFECYYFPSELGNCDTLQTLVLTGITSFLSLISNSSLDVWLKDW